MTLLTSSIAEELVRSQGSNIIIPRIYKEIESGSFSNYGLSNIFIPDSITTIGDSAFANNELTSVDLPDSISSIGDGAFANNKLSSVDIPDGVASIGDGAFANNKLLQVGLPDDLLSIGDRAFAGNKLTDVFIPSGITAIGEGVFASNELNNIDIPDGIASIGDSAFANNELTSVDLPDSISSIGDNAFANNELTSIDIPSALSVINFGVFKNNKLSRVDIPDNVLSIAGTNPSVTDRRKWHVTGPEYEYQSSGSFAGNQLAIVNLPNGLLSIGDFAFEGNELTVINFPESLNAIGVGAFSSNQLSSVDLPDGISSIGMGAFANNKLKTVDLPRDLISIEKSLFINNQITSIDIPDGVISIDQAAFYGNQLTNVNLPDSIVLIGWDKDKDPGGFDEIAWFGVFGSNDDLKTLSIPRHLTSIGNEFVYGRSLQTLSVPKYFDFEESFLIEGGGEDAVFGGSSYGDQPWIGPEIIRRDNESPYGILLSKSTISENLDIGVPIIVLSTIDEVGDVHSYDYAEGEGGDDNQYFSISGNFLSLNSSVNFEKKSVYKFRLRTTDLEGLTFEEALILDVKDVNESPGDLAISMTSFDENIIGGSTVANLSAIDEDFGDVHSYVLVNGTGSSDNDAFTVDGDHLKVLEVPDFESKSSYSIRVQAKDSGGLTFEKSFNLSVNDINEIDYDFNGDKSLSIEEDAVIGLRSMLGTFPGDALTNSALNDESSKSLVQVQQEMTGYFHDSHFDRDADGIISPLTDGIQLIEEMQAMIRDDSSQSVIA